MIFLSVMNLLFLCAFLLRFCNLFFFFFVKKYEIYNLGYYLSYLIRPTIAMVKQMN